MSRTFFAYHIAHEFGAFKCKDYYTNSTKPTEGDFVYVLSGHKIAGRKGVDYYLEGVFRIERRSPQLTPLRSLKGELTEFRYRLTLATIRVPDHPLALENEAWYSREELHRYFSSAQNFNPLPTSPDYKTRFDEVLAGFGSDEADRLLEDLSALQGEVSDETERERLAKARVGQGRFRADLVKLWRKGETCALTGVSIPEMLVASHIKPWRDSTDKERLDPMNGLLLVTHVDKLFDRHLLSFQDGRDGFSCVLHPRVRAEMNKLGVKVGMKLDTSHIGFDDEFRLKKYMSIHFQRYLALVERDRPVL